jgi:hypothetical protein
MSAAIDPELQAVLLELAEGRLEPERWLQWWDEHAAEVERSVNRGTCLRLQPRTAGGRGPNTAAWGSQVQAKEILDRLGVPCDFSERYRQGAEEEQRAFETAWKAREAARAAQYAPLVKALEPGFPRFARFLSRRIELLEEASTGASEAELAELEGALGQALPGSYRRFLQCARALTLCDTLYFGEQHPFPHPSGRLCIAEFWLHADGDQVLFDLRGGTVEDPPVLYYAHETGKPRQIAPAFTAWIEGLSRSAAFR